MRHRPNPRTRAFSLIEILLALGLLLMVVALVGPALYERIAPRTFDYTSGQIAREIRLAREDARRTGDVTLVYATPDPDTGRTRLETRLRPPEDVAGASPVSPAFLPVNDPFGGFADPEFGRFGGTDSPGESGTSGFTGDGFRSEEDRPVLLLELPDGYRVTPEPPVSLTEDLGFGDTVTQDALDEIGGLTSDDGPPNGAIDPGAEGIGGIAFETPPMLIAVCVPDGTVIPAGPVYVVDPDDRVAQLIIEQASGVIVCERVERRPADDPFAFGQDGAVAPARPDPRTALDPRERSP